MYKLKHYWFPLLVTGFLLSGLITACGQPGPTASPPAAGPGPGPEAEITPSAASEEPETAASVSAGSEWVEWGFPIWGDDYKETPGARVHFVKKDEIIKDGEPFAIYYAVADGLPPDKVYYLWTKKIWEKEPSKILPTEIIIGDKGYLFPGQKKIPLTFATRGYVKGEAMEVALMNENKSLIAFGKIIPHPIETRQGNLRMWVELASAKGDMFIIWGEGFEPDEEIGTTSSSSGEVLKSKLKANAEGKFMAIVLPAVIGKEDGTATYSAAGKAGEVEVSYQWGPPALKSPDP